MSKLGDLNDHLFAQLRRISAEDLTAEQIETEAKRAEAIIGLADQVVRNAGVQLQAAKLYADHGDKMLPLLPQIGKS